MWLSEIYLEKLLYRSVDRLYVDKYKEILEIYYNSTGYERYKQCLILLESEEPELIRTRKDAIYVGSKLLSSWDDPSRVEVLDGELDRFNKSRFPEKSEKILLAARRIFFHSLTGYPSYYSEKTNEQKKKTIHLVRQKKPAHVGLLECGLLVNDDPLKTAFDAKGHVDLLDGLKEYKKTPMVQIEKFKMGFISFQKYPYHSIEEEKRKTGDDQANFEQAVTHYKEALKMFKKFYYGNRAEGIKNECKADIAGITGKILQMCTIDGKTWQQAKEESIQEKRLKNFGTILSQAFTYGALLRRLTLMSSILDELIIDKPVQPPTTKEPLRQKKAAEIPASPSPASSSQELPYEYIVIKNQVQELISSNQTTEETATNILNNLNIDITNKQLTNEFFKQIGKYIDNKDKKYSELKNELIKQMTPQSSSSAPEPAPAPAPAPVSPSESGSKSKPQPNNIYVWSDQTKVDKNTLKNYTILDMTNSTLENIEEGTCNGCTSLRFLKFSDSLKTIGDEAFESTSLALLKFPNKLEKIGDGAFKNCKSLKSVVFPNSLQTIGKSAFESCKSLKSVELPDSLKQIEEKTFKNCESLESVVFPKHLEKIHAQAFSRTAIESVVIPETIQEIATNAFNGTLLNNIIVPKHVRSPFAQGSRLVYNNYAHLVQLLLADYLLEDPKIDTKTIKNVIRWNTNVPEVINVIVNGHTLLMAAARKGDLPLTHTLIDAKANVNIADKGKTALMHSAYFNHEKIVLALLKKGAAVDAVDNKGITALMFAAKMGNEKIVRALLANGAAVNAAANNGFTPLMLSADGGYDQVARVLLENGAVVDATDQERWTALLFAAQNGYDQVVRALLENSANVHHVLDDGFTSLLFAAQNGHDQVVLALLENGAAVNVVAKGFTPLIYSAEYGYVEVARILLKNGANVDHALDDGFNALLYAAQNGNDQVVRVLLENGAAVDAQLASGHTALMVSASNGHEEVTRILLENDANVDHALDDGFNALLYAAQNDHDQVVRVLLENGAAIDAQLTSGHTALMVSASNGHEEVVRTLLKADANVEARQNENWTALMYSVQSGHDQVARALLEARASPESQNNDGFTSLMLSAQNGHDLCVRALLENNANVDTVGPRGFTALMFSAQDGHEEVTHTLIKAGANLEARQNQGFTALMIATEKGHEQVARTLIEAEEASRAT
jgi:ankyrin repeat protein